MVTEFFQSSNINLETIWSLPYGYSDAANNLKKKKHIVDISVKINWDIERNNIIWFEEYMYIPEMEWLKKMLWQIALQLYSCTKLNTKLKFNHF